MTKCTKCSSENWSVIERIGALETWRCESCGQEETVHVFDPSKEPLLPSNLEPVFLIAGRWTSKPSLEKISEIQTQIPALRNMPISVLLRKAIEHSDIELGHFTVSEMRNLEPILHRLGIETTKTPITLGSRE